MESSTRIIAHSETASWPYKASWANRLSRWVDGLPGSSLVYYLGLWVSLTLLQIVAMWVEGADPIELFQVPQTFLAAAIAFMVGMFQYFNRRAASALAIIKPALTLDEEG